MGVDGDLLNRNLLLRGVLPGLLAGVDGGGAVVPGGLPEERSAGPGWSVVLGAQELPPLRNCSCCFYSAASSGVFGFKASILVSSMGVALEGGG